MNKIMEPLVSICIPTYNGAKHLRECLGSVLVQTFGNFEVILVDDCSSDNTVVIAQEYAAQDKRIRIERNERNLGLVDNWNRCVELARGEWIKFVFQDDLIRKDCIEKMLKYAEPDTSLICCKRDFYFEEGTDPKISQFFLTSPTVDNLFPGKTKISAAEFCKVFLNHRERFYINFIGEPTAVMIKRNTFYRFGSFNKHFISLCDYEYWLRVAVNNGLTYVPETLATFRVHNLATTTRDREKRSYRMGILDPLLLLHEFSLNPLFKPLRDAAAKLNEDVDLTNWLAYETREAYRKAFDKEHKESITQRLQELRNLTRDYPVLEILSQKIWIHSRKLRRVIKIFKFQSLRWKIHLTKAQFWFLVHLCYLRWIKILCRYILSRDKLIAISLTEHIGDIIASEPISRYIREKYPRAYIIWCARRPYRELIDMNPNIDKTLAVYCLTEWIYLAKTKIFDEIIDLHFEDRECPFCGIHLKKNAGDREIDFKNYFNYGNLLEAYCRCAGLPILNDKSRLYILSRHTQAVRNLHLPDKYLAIHCASNQESKDWTSDKWMDLAERIISNLKIPVVEVGLKRQIQLLSSEGYFNLCGKLSLMELAEVIKRSCFFVGVDSGPAHMANAVSTPGVILLGSIGNFKRYNPFNGLDDNNSGLELINGGGPLANLVVNRVYETIVNKWNNLSQKQD